MWFSGNARWELKDGPAKFHEELELKNLTETSASRIVRKTVTSRPGKRNLPVRDNDNTRRMQTCKLRPWNGQQLKPLSGHFYDLS